MPVVPVSSSFPASVSQLKSRAIPAVESRGVVVAVVSLHPAERHGWCATFAVGRVGTVCVPVARTSVAGRTRGEARRSAVELARRYARALTEPPALPLPQPLSAASSWVRESPMDYGAPAQASPVPDLAEPLEHVEIVTLPAGGFLLTLTGGGFDGTCVVIAPREAALWLVVEDLAGLCGGPTGPEAIAREAVLLDELLRLLYARAAGPVSRRAA